MQNFSLVFQEQPLFTTTSGCAIREAMDDENQRTGSLFDCDASSRAGCFLFRLTNRSTWRFIRRWRFWWCRWSINVNVYFNVYFDEFG